MNTPRIKLLLIASALLAGSCTPQGARTAKDVARTVVDAARIACEVAFGEQPPPAGLSVDDVCKAREQLDPFVDAILAARREVGVGLGEAPKD